MKINTVHEVFQVGFYLILTGFILGGCSAPKQPYYFSKYTRQEISSHKIKADANSVDSTDSNLTTLNNSIQKDALLASTSMDPDIVSRKKIPSEILNNRAFAKNQVSHKQQKIGLIKTWKALRNVKSTFSKPPKDRKKNSAFYIGLMFGPLLIFNKYLAIVVVTVLLIVLGALLVLHIKESKIKKERKLKVNSGEMEQNLNSGQEIKSEEESKIQKKKRRLTMLAIILCGMVLSYTITYLFVSVYRWLSNFGPIF